MQLVTMLSILAEYVVTGAGFAQVSPKFVSSSRRRCLYTTWQKGEQHTHCRRRSSRWQCARCLSWGDVQLSRWAFIGRAQLSDCLYYQWLFFMSQWVIECIEVLILRELVRLPSSFKICVLHCSVLDQNPGFSNLFASLEMQFMTSFSSGKCFNC